jgi:8-amino-3,8-dideoxy-alpha-D-manno-octulosonate transaminase
MPGFEIFGDEERREVNEVLDTGVLFRYGFDQARKGRWKALTFEQMLAQRVSAGYCHLCSSGTAALSTALAACGIGAGDEVIVPPFTFVATIESVIGAGAVPVFAEIDETLCLSPTAVEKAVTDRTRAVIVVHMCGAMARIDEINSFCNEKGLTLIEDACQALGATYNGKSLGTFGKAGCFSFDAVKTVTCGEGGAVVTDDETCYNLAQQFADHGHDHIGDDRGKEKHPILGTNFRISELNAAVGIAQLAKLDRMLEIQRNNKNILKDAAASCPGVTLQDVPDPAGDSATFLSFFLPDEVAARKASRDLAEAGVDGCFYWYDNNWHYHRQWDHLKRLDAAAAPPIDQTARDLLFRDPVLPESDALMSKVLSLLIKLSWSEGEISRRAEALRKVLGGE